MKGRQLECAGCLKAIRSDCAHLQCHFHRRPFDLPTGQARPCGTAYHVHCFRAGPPFTSRREREAGLYLPAIRFWPCFVCELCTVRSVLQRELGHPGDLWLLQLERVRLLDSLHNWAESTTRTYQSKLKQLHLFERAHPGLQILTPSDFGHPSRGAEIGLMWAILHASVQPLKFRGRSSKHTPVFGTIRAIRSAASQYLGWDLITSKPGGTLYFQDRRLLAGTVRPTDGASFELFSRGLQARLGDAVVPSTALLGRHIRGLDTLFDGRYRAAPNATARAEYALAGFANILLWFTWLRGGELFRLRWEDLSIIWPHESPAHDLPMGSGAILLQLTPETKSSRSRTADLVVALRSATGLDLDKWLRRVLLLHPLAPTGQDFVFCPPGRRRWDSHLYRTRFLYPGLDFLRHSGDAYLQTIGTHRGNCIPDKFYSLHSYRRGARTHCQRSQPDPQHRKATEPQVYEHGRWRIPRGSQPIVVQYREWTLYERLRMTLYCH